MDYSTHAQFDDARYWRFERQSHLPVGTFPRRTRWHWPSADRVVCLVVAVGGIIAAVAEWAGR